MNSIKLFYSFLFDSVMITIMTAQVQEAIEDDRPTRLFQRQVVTNEVFAGT